MIFRIFIAFIALLCIYIGYDSGAIMWSKHSANKAEEWQIQETAAADITIVEFLDYSCRHCQDFHPIVMRSLERDGKARYIIKPIPSEADSTGTKAAQLVYAAGRQGKFFEAHNILIENFRVVDDEYARKVAEQLELNAEQLLQDMADPKIEKMLQKNLKNLKGMRGNYVPALLVNNRVLFEVTSILPTSDELLGLFNRARTL